MLHSVWGQTADTLSLTLRQVLERALEHSAQVRQARWEQEAAVWELRDQKRAALVPRVQVSAGIDYVPGLPTTFLPGALLGRPEGTYVAATLGLPWQTLASMQLEQPLFDLSVQRLAPAMGIGRTLQALRVELTEEAVLFQAATLFYQALQARAMLRAVDAHLQQLEVLERMVQLQAKSDLAVQTDVQRVRVALSSLRARRHELEGGIEAVEQGIQFLCRLPLGQPIALRAPVIDTAQWALLPAEVVEQSAAYRLLENRLSLLRIQERSERARGLPKVHLYAQAGVLSQRTDARFTAPDGRWYALGQVGLRLAWPLLDGYRHRYRVERLRREQAYGGEEREQLVRLQELERRQAQMQWENARRTLRAQAESVALARDLVERSRLTYREGTAPLSDLLAAQTALAEAETQYEQQVFSCRLAELQWLKAAGRLRTLLAE